MKCNIYVKFNKRNMYILKSLNKQHTIGAYIDNY